MPKILLVEDNETNRNMLSYRLKRRNYELVIAVDGAEAVSQAKSEHPDLILMDLSLPVMNGWDATREIKANPDTKNIPVIALTAHAMAGDRQKALEAGCDEYETKPVNFPRLQEKVEALLQQNSSSSDEVTSNIDADKSQAPPPLVAVGSSTQEPIAAEPSVAQSVATKILLVEDNETNRNMLSYRLKRRNYELVIAVDGAEAVSQAKSEHPDLILMDLSLPVMNGWDATREIKANPDTKNIPVIALTAHAMAGDRQKALEAGCDEYETKPINFPRLQEKVEALLQQNSSSSDEATSKINSEPNPTKSPSIVVESSTQKPTETAEPSVAQSVATKILLVEDNEVNRNMLSYRLKRKGCELIIAVDGTEGVFLAVAEQPALILMDLNLPVKDGWQATREIKTNPETRHIPIIALTAHNTSSDRQKAIEAGCDDYDTKPVDFSRLIGKIEALLERNLSSQLEKISSKIDSIEAKAELKLTEAEQLKQQAELIESNKVESSNNLDTKFQMEAQSSSNSSLEKSKLLLLPQAIKILYAPIGTRLWRTGSLVELSREMAVINSKRTENLSFKTKIEIRIWFSNFSQIDEKIYAEVLKVSEQNNEEFMVEFSSKYTQISELLSTLHETSKI